MSELDLAMNETETKPLPLVYLVHLTTLSAVLKFVVQRVIENTEWL